MKYEVHVSDIKAFKQCRRRWDWSSMLPYRRGLERKIRYAPFFTGSAVHYGLQRFYEVGEDPVQAAFRNANEQIQKMEEAGALWESEVEVLNGQLELIGGMLSHYLQWTKNETGWWSDKNLRFLALETEFKVPFVTPGGRKSTKTYLAGRFDGVVQRIDNGTLWLFETKTTRSIKELTDSLWNEEQTGAYILAAEHIFKKKISGVLYNVLRKKVPTEPQVLKNGKLQKRADLATTAEAYFDACKQHHSDWTVEEIQEEYGEYLQGLLDRGNEFFAREPVYRSRSELRQLQLDLWAVSLEMSRKTTSIYPSPSWLNCKFCTFRAPCQALNAGADFEDVLEQEYVHRENWNPLEGKMEESD